MREILVMGHRGSPRAAPENTLKSFEIAMQAGADMVEVDVWRTTDGHIVCMHDPDVSSTTNGVGRIEELTLEEIKSLDAGEGQQVPLLSEVFDLVQGKIGINIDLKSIGIEEPVVDLVTERGMLDSSIISSFYLLSIEIVKKLNKDAKTGAIFQLGMEDIVTHTLNAGADAIHPVLSDVTKDLVEEAHGEGLKVNVWGVDDEADILCILEWGVNGIITDVPEVGVRVVDDWLSEKIQ
ncbi:MAG: glycerophosphodiester phosphodiesterase [Candidatus Thorarchaeota archaeon]|jgi:glycerophosphoryl diester phosphodiesterase